MRHCKPRWYRRPIWSRVSKNLINDGNSEKAHPPPTMEVTQAPIRMTSAWANTMGKAKPVTTMMEVIKRPRSTRPELSAEKSFEPQWGNNAFGRGASTNVTARSVVDVNQKEGSVG